MGWKRSRRKLPQRDDHPETLRIGYRGRLDPVKGVDILIQAFRRISGNKLALYIYGPMEVDNPYHNRLLKMAEGDARIHFMGRYSNADLESILQNIDVTVVPSRGTKTSRIPFSNRSLMAFQ
jgi:glycosyltransferase involved in cell wall biosynthesis